MLASLEVGPGGPEVHKEGKKLRQVSLDSQVS